VNQIVSIARENDVVMAQVESNTRDQALKGNLPGAVQQGVVRALTSHQKLATLVLKSDRQAMAALTDVIYELIRNQKNIDLDDLVFDLLNLPGVKPVDYVLAETHRRC
jgi:type I restriction enzyme R subunit